MKRASLVPTGEATVGPFFPPRYVDAGANDLTALEGRRARGEPIEIRGVVREEGGAALENLIVEIWQADARGIYRHPADPRHAEADPDFLGWGRIATDAAGNYRFRTIRPGAPAGRAPHINVMLMVSGLMRILKTALYFEGDPRNDADPVLRLVDLERRNLLISKKADPSLFRFDVQLRGGSETPFFDD
jgi:protocatechuate 3,4-dioxygenase alpha subunit